MSLSAAPTPVLVVEDDPILMMALVGFVEEAGHEAVEADIVEAALCILETRPDIRTVFIDLDTRKAKAGIDLALAVRDRWAPIALLMISSVPWAECDLPERGMLMGKPFDRRKIVATLKKLAA